MGYGGTLHLGRLFEAIGFALGLSSGHLFTTWLGNLHIYWNNIYIYMCIHDIIIYYLYKIKVYIYLYNLKRDIGVFIAK